MRAGGGGRARRRPGRARPPAPARGGGGRATPGTPGGRTNSARRRSPRTAHTTATPSREADTPRVGDRSSEHSGDACRAVDDASVRNDGRERRVSAPDAQPTATTRDDDADPGGAGATKREGVDASASGGRGWPPGGGRVTVARCVGGSAVANRRVASADRGSTLARRGRGRGSAHRGGYSQEQRSQTPPRTIHSRQAARGKRATAIKRVHPHGRGGRQRSCSHGRRSPDPPLPHSPCPMRPNVHAAPSPSHTGHHTGARRLAAQPATPAPLPPQPRTHRRSSKISSLSAAPTAASTRTSSRRGGGGAGSVAVAAAAVGGATTASGASASGSDAQREKGDAPSRSADGGGEGAAPRWRPPPGLAAGV